MIKIAPEGYPYIIVFFVLTIAVGYFSKPWFAVVPGILFIFMLFFFRDPDRVLPEGESVITSPADGEIIVIHKEREEEYLRKEIIKVSIFMSPFNVHVNRAPYNGKVKLVKHNPGSFSAAFKDEASLENDNIAMVLNTEKGDILVRQVAGFLARRAVCRVKPGDSLTRGDKFGIIKFSSRVDIYLPPEVEVRVNIGDMVKAGSTIIADFSDNLP